MQPLSFDPERDPLTRPHRRRRTQAGHPVMQPARQFVLALPGRRRERRDTNCRGVDREVHQHMVAKRLDRPSVRCQPRAVLADRGTTPDPRIIHARGVGAGTSGSSPSPESSRSFSVSAVSRQPLVLCRPAPPFELDAFARQQAPQVSTPVRDIEQPLVGQGSVRVQGSACLWQARSRSQQATSPASSISCLARWNDTPSALPTSQPRPAHGRHARGALPVGHVHGPGGGGRDLAGRRCRVRRRCAAALGTARLLPAQAAVRVQLGSSTWCCPRPVR